MLAAAISSSAWIVTTPKFLCFDSSSVHPGDEAEGEHVLRPLGLLLAHTEALDGANGDRRHRDRVDLIAVQGPVGRRVRGVARLLEVPLGERVLVDDDRAAPCHL